MKISDRVFAKKFASPDLGKPLYRTAVTVHKVQAFYRQAAERFVAVLFGPPMVFQYKNNHKGEKKRQKIIVDRDEIRIEWS